EIPPFRPVHEVWGELVGEPAQRRQRAIEEYAQSHGTAGRDYAYEQTKDRGVAQSEGIPSAKRPHDRGGEQERRIENGRQGDETGIHRFRWQAERGQVLHERP
ncbi:MAG: hypothetical protein LC781_21120, partial [Actinobacteria bacterium]|nr:hypothetical protein [Actinomycetota bacterium]